MSEPEEIHLCMRRHELCTSCKHYNEANYTCAAYPEKIPAAFLDGYEHHFEFTGDDNGIKFELPDNQDDQVFAFYLMGGFLQLNGFDLYEYLIFEENAEEQIRYEKAVELALAEAQTKIKKYRAAVEQIVYKSETEYQWTFRAVTGAYGKLGRFTVTVDKQDGHIWTERDLMKHKAHRNVYGIEINRLKMNRFTILNVQPLATFNIGDMSGVRLAVTIQLDAKIKVFTVSFNDLKMSFPDGLEKVLLHKNVKLHEEKFRQILKSFKYAIYGFEIVLRYLKALPMPELPIVLFDMEKDNVDES